METSKNAQTCSSTIFDGLPMEMGLGGRELYQWKDFWYTNLYLPQCLAARSYFQAHEDDVIIASSMKTGTTWLKALIWCIMHCKPQHDDNNNDDDALVKNNPHLLMPVLELKFFGEYPKADISGMPSPRLLQTHVPYMMLSDSVKESNCKIVYITRDPKDVFVSLWHFYNANHAKPEQGPDPLDEAFDKYCKGIHPIGPFHDHVLSYWKESLKRPGKILFLKYEELKRDPKGQLQKLASFLGRPIAEEDVIDNILWRCSLERLKNLEVNQNGSLVGCTYKSFFRLGSVGDWKNYLSKEMKDRLDNITRMKFESSGLDLEIS
ncbi:cytosolic sulfotransferase 5-like [Tripterygium wilfordii]|uniref:cytosolic sulfotransferase 5-like n=1 Tax=Tripterygium wilfordii TaxID=458696 RepID=UPI0018F824BB|nr:cytosolic sulfotransferase 5-like [Tripterygium wilfordii]